MSNSPILKLKISESYGGFHVLRPHCHRIKHLPKHFKHRLSINLNRASCYGNDKHQRVGDNYVTSAMRIVAGSVWMPGVAA